ncbi:uncharacterized protein LOC112593952 [Melanaphis sacchari]|uniref:uncharacterized protein LOC112593952 n=1 Tax=Melanaphis sacchari TaxID=742174 RepID=UPI000DC142BD|nr:uncharacterized protein LOC112593952 [Melanaphis sacchari]
MEKNKLFSIFCKPKRSVDISVASINTTNIIVDVEDDASVDDVMPVKAVHEPTQNVQCDINDILDLGDIDSGPATPILDAYPKTCFGSQNRAFTSALFKQFDWLEYSISKDSVFCYACRTFGTKKCKSEEIFITKGFNNWKKVSVYIFKDLLKIDLASLKAEMMVAKNCLEKYEGSETRNQISSFQKCITVETFPNLYKLLNLALSIPISSASCERSFSTMRRISTYIRSTMNNDRFSSLAIINIERDVSNNINAEDILEIYSKENRRLML